MKHRHTLAPDFTLTHTVAKRYGQGVKLPKLGRMPP
jgi:hypothetical protein